MEGINIPGNPTAEGISQSLGLSIFGVSVVLFSIGGLLYGLATTSVAANDIEKDNFRYGGITFFVIGGLVLIYSFIYGSGKSEAFITGVKETSQKPWATVFIVLLTTIAIFTGLFYNYATDQTLTFSTAVLVALIVIGSIGLLYVTSARIDISNVISKFLLVIIYFLPYELFAFGFLTDMLVRKVQFTPASFAGLMGVFMNYAVSLANNGGVPVTPMNPLCEIPGLSFFSSKYVPQSMMFSLSQIAYIATYISRSNVGGTSGFIVSPDYRWPAWVLYFGVWGAQTLTLVYNKCVTRENAWIIILGLVVPLLWGSILGLIGFSVLERSDRNPSGNAAPPGGPVLGGAGSTTPTVGTCSAGSSDGEFICESFENGKLKTRKITE